MDSLGGSLSNPLWNNMQYTTVMGIAASNNYGLTLYTGSAQVSFSLGQYDV